MSTGQYCSRDQYEDEGRENMCQCYDCIILFRLKLKIEFISDIGKTLIILPKSLISNWATEIKNLIGEKLTVYEY